MSNNKVVWNPIMPGNKLT